jgi:hypothetical protein
MLLIAFIALVDARTTTHMRQSLAAINALSLAEGAEIAQMEYRAVNGEWPTSDNQARFSDKLPEVWIRSASIRDGGAVDFTFATDMPALKGQILSFRAWQAQDASSPLVWVCGHGRAASLAPASVDLTTLADRMLPSPCRMR